MMKKIFAYLLSFTLITISLIFSNTKDVYAADNLDIHYYDGDSLYQLTTHPKFGTINLIIPSKENYIFEGWYTSKSAASSKDATYRIPNNQLDTSTVPGNSLNLYAAWYDAVKISGTITSDNSSFVYSKDNFDINLSGGSRNYDLTLNQDGTYEFSIIKGETVSLNIGYPFRNIQKTFNTVNSSLTDQDISLNQIIYELKTEYTSFNEFSVGDIIPANFSIALSEDGTKYIYLDEYIAIDNSQPYYHTGDKLLEVTQVEPQTIYLNEVLDEKYIKANLLSESNRKIINDESFIYINNQKFHITVDNDTIDLSNNTNGHYLIYIDNDCYKKSYTATGNVINLSKHTHDYDTTNVTYSIGNDKVTASVNCTVSGETHTYSETTDIISYTKTSRATNFEDEVGTYVFNFNSQIFGTTDITLTNQAVPNTKLGFKIIGELNQTYNHNGSLYIQTNGIFLDKDGHRGVGQPIFYDSSKTPHPVPNDKYTRETLTSGDYEFIRLKIYEDFLNTLTPGKYSVGLIYSCNIEPHESITIPENQRPTVTITPTPTSGKYTLCYHYGGAKADVVEEHSKSESVTVPSVNIPGFVFHGWYTDRWYQNEYTNETIEDVQSDYFDLWAKVDERYKISGHIEVLNKSYIFAPSYKDFVTITSGSDTYTLDSLDEYGNYSVLVKPNSDVKFSFKYPFKNKSQTIHVEKANITNDVDLFLMFEDFSTDYDVAGLYSGYTLPSNFTLHNNSTNTYTIHYKSEDPITLSNGDSFTPSTNSGKLLYVNKIEDDDYYINTFIDDDYINVDELEDKGYIDSYNHVYVNNKKVILIANNKDLIDIETPSNDYYLIHIDDNDYYLNSIDEANNTYTINLSTHLHNTDGEATYTWDTENNTCTGSIDCITEGQTHSFKEIARAYYSSVNATNFKNEIRTYNASFDADCFESQSEHVIEIPNTIVDFKLLNEGNITYNGNKKDILIKTTCCYYSNYKVTVDGDPRDYSNGVNVEFDNENGEYYNFILTYNFLDELYIGDHNIQITIYGENEQQFKSIIVPIEVVLAPNTADLCIAYSGDYVLYMGDQEKTGNDPVSDLDISFSNNVYTLTLNNDIVLDAQNVPGIKTHNGKSIDIKGNGHKLTINVTLTEDTPEYYAIQSNKDLSINKINSSRLFAVNSPTQTDTYDLTLTINDKFSETNNPNIPLHAPINAIKANEKLSINKTLIAGKISGSLIESLDTVDLTNSYIEHNVYLNYKNKTREVPGPSGDLVTEKDPYGILTIGAGGSSTSSYLKINNCTVKNNFISTSNPASIMSIGIEGASNINIDNSTIDLKNDSSSITSEMDVFGSSTMSGGIVSMNEDFESLTLPKINIIDSDIKLTNYTSGITGLLTEINMTNSDIDINSTVNALFTFDKINLTYDDANDHLFKLQIPQAKPLDFDNGSIPIILCGFNILSNAASSGPIVDYSSSFIIDATDYEMKSDLGDFDINDIESYKMIMIGKDLPEPAPEPSSPSNNSSGHIIPNTSVNN